MERITLSNVEFEGDNNAYLFDPDGSPTLVDTGVATDAVADRLASGLGEFGLSFADVDRVVLTHWHQDHAGLAKRIQEAGDADVFVHEADAELVAGPESPYDRLADLRRERFDAWGMPDDAREELETFLRTSEPGEYGVSVERFDDGDRLSAGDRTLEAVHAPGHTAGLACFAFEDGDERAVLAGDALLPQYTPNVGGADLRLESPLERYVETLHRMIEIDPDVAYPGHREPIDDPAGRAREILDHHADRAVRVVDALDRLGPATAWAVSADLFGDLSGIHIIHGPGEAWAHLEHLRDRGLVALDEGGYRLTDEARSLRAESALLGELGIVARS